MPTLTPNTPAHRLRIYISEGDRWRGRPLYAALVETLKELGLAGATVLRGVAGFGAHSRIHSAAILERSPELPLVLETVDTPENIARALERILPMVGEGLITREEVQVLRYTQRYLNPLPADRPVGEVMTGEVISLAPEDTLETAWKRMLEYGLKVLPVIDSNRQVVGILTDSDLIERGGLRQRLSIAMRLDPALLVQEMRRLRQAEQTVGQVMTRPVVTVAESEAVGIAAAGMIRAGLKRLPVVDGKGRLVGMLSRLDILRLAVQAAPPLPQAAFHPGAVRTVGQVMRPELPTAAETDPLPVLVEKFAASGAHRLVVVDGQGRATGLVSDSDVVASLQPQRQGGILDAIRRLGKPPAGQETAAGLMSPGPLCAPPDLPVAEAGRRMLEESRKWLVVVDPLGRPLGLVDRQVLLEALVS